MFYGGPPEKGAGPPPILFFPDEQRACQEKAASRKSTSASYWFAVMRWSSKLNHSTRMVSTRGSIALLDALPRASIHSFFGGGSILTHAHELIHCQSHCILVTRSNHGSTTYGPPLWVPCFLKGIPSTPSCQVPWELLGNSYPQATNWIDVHLAWGKLQPPNVLFGLSDVMKVSFIRSCFCW